MSLFDYLNFDLIGLIEKISAKQAQSEGNLFSTYVLESGDKQFFKNIPIPLEIICENYSHYTGTSKNKKLSVSKMRLIYNGFSIELSNMLLSLKNSLLKSISIATAKFRWFKRTPTITNIKKREIFREFGPSIIIFSNVNIDITHEYPKLENKFHLVPNYEYNFEWVINGKRFMPEQMKILFKENNIKYDITSENFFETEFDAMTFMMLMI